MGRGFGLKVSLFVVAVCFGAHGRALAEEPAPLTIKAGNEALVAVDIGGGLPFRSIEWCGNDALLFDGDKSGKERVDLKGNRIIVSAKGSDRLIGCTPDGEWVLYKDGESAREYRDRLGKAPENVADEGPGWYGFVIDLYRYEISTGARQKFAVVRDDGSVLVSPDGTKVLLGNRHDMAIEMPEPKWEKVWLMNELDSGLGYAQSLWLTDSSGIATETWGGATSSLVVEIFGDKGWTKEFSLEALGTHFSLEAVDKENGLRFAAWEERVVDRFVKTSYKFFRCAIKGKELACEQTGGLDEEEADGIASLELLANGDVVFEKRDDDCIRRVKAGTTVAGCIAYVRHESDDYTDISLIGVSPDGRRLAFRRGKLPPKQEGRFYAYQYDVFVKELR